MNCPNCGSQHFFYVQCVWEYHTFSDVSENYVELDYLDDTVINDNEQIFFRCIECDIEYTQTEMEEMSKKWSKT